MNTIGQPKKPAVQNSGINPFAQALVEHGSRSDKNISQTKSDSQLFSEALARTGGNLGESNKTSANKDLAKQQQELKKQHEQDLLRKKLHDKVNPVDNHAVFEARKERELKEIDQLRKEVALLMADIGSLQKEAEVTLMTQIADPGQEGSYFKNFFLNLRSFIMLLRQKVKSARTWAKQMQSRKKKMAKKRGGGMVVDTQETKFVQDTMHHEKSTAYSGS
ncbi:MAG: hypothetical protein IT416_01595 [Candidatus Pacebacteria bacterium]|nr:hypothetical protein [Candidatus Paceibacterota bacterium]